METFRTIAVDRGLAEPMGLTNEMQKHTIMIEILRWLHRNYGGVQ